MQKIINTTVKTAMCIALASTGYASLSISDYQPEKVQLSDAPNGNEMATVSNMPLDIYLKSIYSGYSVKFDQMNNMPISIQASDKVANNAPSILGYLSKTYQISFDLNNTTHTISVTPSNNVSYQSYQEGLKALNKERADLALDYQQKTKNYDHLANENTVLYQHLQALSQSGDDLDNELKKLLQNGELSKEDTAKIKHVLNKWQLTQNKLPKHLKDMDSAPLIKPVKQQESKVAPRIIDNLLVVSPFIPETEKKHIESIYTKNKNLVEDEKIKDSEFINAFIAELDNKELHVYQNTKTHKTAIAKTTENAQLLTNDKVFYAFKGDSVKEIFTKWGKKEHIDFDLSDVPVSVLNIKLSENHIYKGVILSSKDQINAVGELLKMAITSLKNQENAKAIQSKK